MSKANEALDKMAENARELGLDYEPAQQEPVAWLEILRNNKTATDEVIGAFLRGHAEHLTRETFVLSTPAAPQPAQRPWVGLTDEEKSDIWCVVTNRDFVTEDTHVYADAIEAKLKEKNA